MMKKLITATVVAAAVFLSASAQTINIHTANGVKTYNLAQIDSVTFDEKSEAEDLVKMEIVNACAFSFDLNAEKSPSCHKYMVAVYNKNVFNVNTFIESAIQTLDPYAYYRPFEKTLSYESKSFPESSLGLNSIVSDEGVVTFVAACYAIDDLGENKVYTREFTLPTTPKVESSEKATVTIDETTLRYDHIDFSIRCGWNTAKIIYAATQPSYLDSKLSPTVWNGMTLEQQKAKLLSVYQGIPETYKSGMSGSYECNANSTCIVYAIPIDRDGKIGEMDVKTINTGAVPVDGKGEFVGVTPQTQTEWSEYSFNVAVSQDAVAYRLMWFTETEEKNSEYLKRLPEIFSNKKYQQYNMWQEFSADQTIATLDVFRPGEKYYLCGTTVDRFGNISLPVNLGELYLGSKTIPTITKPDVE